MACFLLSEPQHTSSGWPAEDTRRTVVGRPAFPIDRPRPLGLAAPRRLCIAVCISGQSREAYTKPEEFDLVAAGIGDLAVRFRIQSQHSPHRLPGRSRVMPAHGRALAVGHTALAEVEEVVVILD